MERAVDPADRFAGSIAMQLEAIVRCSNDAIYSKTLDGCIVTWNPAAERIFGYSSREIAGRPGRILVPADRHDEEPEILARVGRGEYVEHYETVRQRKDGRLVDVSLTVSPIADAEGRIVGASKIARDISERRLEETRRILLLKEMNHRIKNLFAQASALVTLSERGATTPKDLSGAIKARLGALARAHDLILPEINDEGVSFERSVLLLELVRTIISPYADLGPATSPRISARGPEILLEGRMVSTLALLFHELTTNAMKHGAFTTLDGYVELTWSLEAGEFRLLWEEHGGPSLAAAPTSEGFGTVLADRLVTLQLGGTITRDWRPHGLVLGFMAPAEALSRRR
jgi:PAS domain S-box-containing protein